MSFWRSRELSPSGCSVKSKGKQLLLLVTLLKVTFVGVTSYGDFQEVTAALTHAEGVEKLFQESEAPGLITLSLQYNAPDLQGPQGLIDKLSALFPKKYKMTPKDLPSGVKEIEISRQGS